MTAYTFGDNFDIYLGNGNADALVDYLINDNPSIFDSLFADRSHLHLLFVNSDVTDFNTAAEIPQGYVLLDKVVSIFLYNSDTRDYYLWNQISYNSNGYVADMYDNLSSSTYYSEIVYLFENILYASSDLQTDLLDSNNSEYVKYLFYDVLRDEYIDPTNVSTSVLSWDSETARAGMEGVAATSLYLLFYSSTFTPAYYSGLNAAYTLECNIEAGIGCTTFSDVLECLCEDEPVPPEPPVPDVPLHLYAFIAHDTVSSPGTLYTDNPTLVTGMQLYDENGIATEYEVGEIAQDGLSFNARRIVPHMVLNVEGYRYTTNSEYDVVLERYFGGEANVVIPEPEERH